MEKILKKLGWKNGSRVCLVNAPPGIFEELAPLFLNTPETEFSGQYDFVMYFTTQLASIHRDAGVIVEAMAPEGRLWICYPKKSSKQIRSDLSRDILWPVLGDYNYEPVSQFAVDDDWSAMRFRPVDEIKSLTRRRAVSPKGKKRLE